jgi:hypothetical protein
MGSITIPSTPFTIPTIPLPPPVPGPQGPPGAPGSGNFGLVNVKDAPYLAIGDGIANDTAAIQAAIDSGQGNPIVVYFPTGTYKVYPPNPFGAPCLALHYDNVTMLGCGPTQSIIKCYTSGGRDPNTTFDAVNWGVGQSVWRGSGMLIGGNPQSAGARAVNGASTGKLYFEWTSQGAVAVGGGLSGLQYEVKDFPGGNSFGFLGAFQSVSVFGTVFINSLTPVANLGTVNQGDVLAIAVDLTARLLWTKNITQASAWNANGAANPATGVGGLDISSLPSVVYPTVDLLDNSQVTLNLGTAAYVGVVPSGFGNWPGGGGFNPADSFTTRWITLSNNNLIATRPHDASTGRNNFAFDNLRITGQCLRSTATFPFGPSNPPNQPGLVGPNADGWDLSHHAFLFDAFVAHNHIRLLRSEIDGFKGETIIGSNAGSQDWKIDSCHLHDGNADIINCPATPLIVSNNLIHDGTNLCEMSPFNFDQVFENNYCYNFNSGFVITNQTAGGGDAALNGKTIIRDNVLISAVIQGVFVQAFAKQVWVKGNTFVDCGHFSGNVVMAPFNSAPTTTYTGMNIVIEDNQFFANLSGLGGISISVDPSSTPVTQIFVRRNRLLLTPTGFDTVGAGFGTGLQYTLQNNCTLFVEDNDFAVCSSPAFVDFNPGHGKAIFRRNVQAQALPYPDRVMLYTQFDKTNDTTLANIGLAQALGLAGIYTFTARLLVAANASGGAKVSMTFSGTVNEFYALAKFYAGTSLVASGTLGTVGVTAAVDLIELTGYVIPYKLLANAGSLDVSFAQNASFGTASSVLKGSFLSVCESQYQATF